MNQVFLGIPAKALLFGEYGVLFGGKAIAVTFFDHSFEISLQIKKIKNSSLIQVNSDFFSDKKIQFSIQNMDSEIKTNPNIFFFVNLLKPWGKYLLDCKLEITIHKSFSSALGFGSSSALIAGISSGLWQLIFHNKDYFNQVEFWSLIKQSIQNIQGSGSGYDVAVQLAAIENNDLISKTKFWIYQNKQNSIIPNIEQYKPKLSITELGCFISTNIYSNTTKAIQKFENDKEKIDYANKHSHMCELFLNINHLEELKVTMKNSVNLAENQNILPLYNENFNFLISILNSKKIAFKTMGAGYGDCLWVIAKKQTLINECKILEADIPFAFETYGTNL